MKRPVQNQRLLILELCILFFAILYVILRSQLFFVTTNKRGEKEICLVQRSYIIENTVWIKRGGLRRFKAASASHFIMHVVDTLWSTSAFVCTSTINLVTHIWFIMQALLLCPYYWLEVTHSAFVLLRLTLECIFLLLMRLLKKQ